LADSPASVTAQPEPGGSHSLSFVCLKGFED